MINSISVIIPVYNAEKYVRRAVESAINLSEVAEIILIEDGSPDNALEVCKTLQKEHPKVKLLRHENGINKGAGATRNLGISTATSKYIAFLDADDYYLSNRFDVEKILFNEQPDIDGIYGCIKAEFETEDAKELFFKRFKSEYTTLKEIIPPDDLLETLMFGDKGYFSTDAITLKKSVFEKVGLFDEELKLSQDTHLWFKLAAKCKLVSGNIKTPIAIRGVHADNRVHSGIDLVQNFHDLLYTKLFYWSVQQKEFSYAKKNRFFYAIYHLANPNKRSPLNLLMEQVKKHPLLLRNLFFYRKLFQLYFQK